MKIKFTSKPVLGYYENERFTFNKEYNVLADYRNRGSHQSIRDNGLVIRNDSNQEVMVFLDEFQISCNEKGNTYTFAY